MESLLSRNSRDTGQPLVDMRILIRLRARSWSWELWWRWWWWRLIERLERELHLGLHLGLHLRNGEVGLPMSWWRWHGWNSRNSSSKGMIRHYTRSHSVRVWYVAGVVLTSGSVCSIALSMYLSVVCRANPAELVSTFLNVELATTLKVVYDS